MNALFDDMYMKQHLGEYVLFQLEQGYALDDIRKALLKFGYKKPLVKEILDRLHITSPRKKTAMYSSEELDAELKIYVQSLLIDYIVREHKVGYPLEAIKKALINYGHDPRVIDEAMMIIEKGHVVDYRKESSMIQFPQQIVASITLFLIFVFLVFLSIATDVSIVKILPNFLPAFVAYLIINTAFFFMPKTKFTVALPLFAVLITVSAFIGGIQYGILGTVPGSDMVLILNAVVAFISSGLVCAFSKKGKDEVIVEIKDKNQKKINAEEHALVEEKIHIPKLGDVVPKEPYHVAGHPKMMHETAKGNQNSMLHFLREEIDKKPTAHSHSLHRPQQRQTQRQRQRQTQTQTQKPSAMYVKHARTPLATVEHLPEQRKKKEQKIALKEME